MTAPRVLLIAGNGFIGSRTAARFTHLGCAIGVHHTGRQPLTQVAAVRSFVVERRAGPIVNFPAALLDFEADVVVHFYCMDGADAEAFVVSFDGRASRLVLVSSCDVYRAYGRFTRLEPGSPDQTPLGEDAPVRRRLHPYRASSTPRGGLEHRYEKLEAERIVATARASETVVLRLPKVYGFGGNHRLDTVYGFAGQPQWRWTHGHVDNVAAAIALAALHPNAAGEVFNVGEQVTPTMGERLACLPASSDARPAPGDYDFSQDLHFDTSKIRRQLSHQDVIDESSAMAATAAGAIAGRLQTANDRPKV
jgi:nucleoside-diphosphate-sugar epimerase